MNQVRRYSITALNLRRIHQAAQSCKIEQKFRKSKFRQFLENLKIVIFIENLKKLDTILKIPKKYLENRKIL